MRRIPAPQRAIELIRSTIPLRHQHFCRTCLLRATAARRTLTTTPIRQIKLPKLWKDDEATRPIGSYKGEIDPYTDPSAQRAGLEAEQAAEEAAAKDKALKEDYAERMRDYEAASTWEGLTWADQWMKAQQPPKIPFTGFAPNYRVEEPKAIVAALHQTLKELCTAEDITLPETLKSPLRAALEEPASSWVILARDKWRMISLPLTIKFWVTKRMLLHTGIRVPDAQLSNVDTVGSLYDQLCYVTRPKPAKLMDRLAGNKKLLNMPNVTLYSRRVTPIDKERDVGRWKVIERELIGRGLPPTHINR